jgi:hypothetical protein
MIKCFPDFNQALDSFKTDEVLGKINDELKMLHSEIDAKNFDSALKKLEHNLNPKDYENNPEVKAHFDTQIPHIF